MLPGYVTSEAYGVNNDRVVFGLLYDKKERAFPFRWENGRMTVLKGPNGRILYTENPGAAAGTRSTTAARSTWTMIVGGDRRAVRWSPDGKATFLPALPGHTWTDAFGINDDGVVSGWSRKLPNGDGEENPVLWTRSGKVVPLKTAPGRADGIAEATNRAGLTVGYLGNQTDDRARERQGRGLADAHGRPLLLGACPRPNVIAELVDVNDRGTGGRHDRHDEPEDRFHARASRDLADAAGRACGRSPSRRHHAGEPGRRHRS